MKKNFNHISNKMDQNKVDQLIKIYDNYYEKYQSEHKKYKKLKRTKITLQTIGLALTAVGAGTSVINPFTLIIAGVGTTITAFLNQSKLENKVEQLKFSSSNYQIICNEIITILRTGEFSESDEIKLLSDLKVIDNIITSTRS